MTPAPRALRSARRRLPLVAATAVVLGACARGVAPAAPPAPRAATGESTLRAMHDRYATKWYRTLTFRRVTTASVGGAERTTTQHATVMLPGRLRYDIDLARGTGQLFASDSQYNVLNNTVRRAAAGHNTVLVFGFDIFAQPPARTSRVLRTLGFPDGPVREATWMERPTWVVGGAANDTHSPQYWVDRERLVVVRVIQPLPADTTQTYDIRFGDFRPAGAGWVAARIEHYQNGQRTLLERYEDVRVDPTVSEALFDPKRWGTAPHWAKAAR
jgi:hypothetical protein